jgi:uncharacterized membrane protein
MNSQLIDQWLKTKLITTAQAEVMRRDITEAQRQKGSQGLVTTVSTLGAALLGIGILVFIASNWTVLSPVTKIALMLAGTFSALFSGYAFGYHWKNLPRVGEALILLSSILYGATIFLVAQIYHVNAHSHSLILLWLGGVLPLVYLLKTNSMTVFATGLFYGWLGFFSLRSLAFESASTAFIGLPVLVMSASTFLFGAGGLHALLPEYKDVGRVFRLAALYAGLAALFLLTFKAFSGDMSESFSSYSSMENTIRVFSQFNTSVLVFSCFAYLSLGIYGLINPNKVTFNKWEMVIGATLLSLSLALLYSSRSTDLFTFVFNAAMIGVLGLLIQKGYERQDLRVVNMSLFFVALYVLARYTDWFWEVLPKSTFFMIGGAMLVGGGIVLERQMKAAKAAFERQRK